jgi:hypothetical protein
MNHQVWFWVFVLFALVRMGFFGSKEIKLRATDKTGYSHFTKSSLIVVDYFSYEMVHSKPGDTGGSSTGERNIWGLSVFPINLTTEE